MSGFKPKAISSNKKMNKIEDQELEFAGGNSDEEEEEDTEDEDDSVSEEDDTSTAIEEEEEDAIEAAEEEDDDDVVAIGGGKDDYDSDDDAVAGAGAAATINPLAPVLDSDDDEDEVDETYLQKFNANVNKNYILDFHPECAVNNYDEIVGLTKILRDSENNIIDDLHKTLPYLTKYERARVLGQRAKQINAGAKVFVKVPENVIDGYLIAEQELAQKRIPFIIRRPTPGGGCEYWNLKDLELIQF
jgi:DNA-directed RNA polymerase I, II, and III subunit RPABC2